jgi:glucose-1-phosphate thymidylyltransferase
MELIVGDFPEAGGGRGMKALVLSGGAGTRLRPITHTSAKQLIPIANKPILFYGLEAIAAAGITEVGIIVGDTHAEIEAAVGDGSRFGIKATYIRQDAPLGLAHAVKIAEDFMAGDSFLMYLGDNLVKDDLGRLVKEFESSGCSSLILLAHVPNPSAFGVAELNRDGTVKRLVEKPKQPPSDLALVGVYLFDSSIYEAVKNIKPSWRNELEITDAIQYLLEHGYKVHHHVIEEWWKDTGKLEDLLEANRIVLEEIEQRIDGEVDGKSRVEGSVVIEKGAKVVESVIRGPAVIGANAVVSHSYIGPFTSICPDVTVENSEIEHSIVCENSVIRDIKRIEGSLIGKSVQIVRSTGRPAAHRIMVGDSSRIEIV